MLENDLKILNETKEQVLYATSKLNDKKNLLNNYSKSIYSQFGEDGFY